MLGSRSDKRLFKDPALVPESSTTPLRIGLTGGIGCGKSTVCHLFEQLGIPVIDTDLIAREIVRPGQPAYQEILTRFGSDILTTNNEINRQLLREIVFNQSGKLQQLEKITHPRIISSMRDQVTQLISPYCILCIPLLLEKKLETEVDRVLVVDLPAEVQKQRVAERDGISLQQVEAIMVTQYSRELRLQHADDVITNTGTIADLEPQVLTLHRRYLALAA